jgi:pimeloyl-ACP methyl ester carboxylesterase
MPTPLDIFLVHGAFADASSWSHVIPILQATGHRTIGVQLPLSSVEDDAQSIGRALEGSPRALLVGHSYGGLVISEAGRDNPNVAGLVYIAAIALDEGEAALPFLSAYPVESAEHYQSDSGGFLVVDRERFPRDFAADVPLQAAQVLAATQKPVSASGFNTPVGAPAWKTLPSWYQISEQDAMIHPDAQRFMAGRANSQMLSLPCSHASMIAHPTAIAEFILSAARSLNERL